MVNTRGGSQGGDGSQSQRAGGQGKSSAGVATQAGRSGSVGGGGLGVPEIAPLRFLGQAYEVSEQARRAALTVLQRTKQQFRQTGHYWGVQRTFQALAGGQPQQMQQTMPQVAVRDQLLALGAHLAQALDAAAAVHWTASQTTVDITVDGQRVLRSVPYTFLPIVQNTLEELRGCLGKIPVQDKNLPLQLDDASGFYRSEPIVTPTQGGPMAKGASQGQGGQGQGQSQGQGPAGQIPGTWRTIRYTGALNYNVAQQLRVQCDKVLQAVILARGEGEAHMVQDLPPAHDILGAIFGSIPELGWQPPLGITPGTYSTGAMGAGAGSSGAIGATSQSQQTPSGSGRGPQQT